MNKEQALKTLFVGRIQKTLKMLDSLEKEAQELRKIIEAHEPKEDGKFPKKWEDLGVIEGTYVESGSHIRPEIKWGTAPPMRNRFPTKALAYRYGVLLPQLLQLRQRWLKDAGFDGPYDEKVYRYAITAGVNELSDNTVDVFREILEFPCAILRTDFRKAFRPQLRIFFGIDPIPDNV